MIRPPVGPDEVGASWSMPAPVLGWNARDALSQMKPGDAIQLDNFFPGTTSVDARPGSITRATIPAGQVIRTLMGLAKADGTHQRFAASATGIYDVTAGGAIAAIGSAATTGEWQYVQINVGGTSFLWCCAGDGVNKSRIYNSTTGTWLELDTATTPALTGVVSEDIFNVSLWKYRLILCERNSLKFHYGPLNSVGGAFSAFDLGQVFKLGGYLVATANWSIDAGDGADDMFVAITSEGEVAIYQGTDPSDVSTFALVGVYTMSKPVGRRCFTQVGGDLSIITEQGMWPLSKALLSATIDKRVALTDRVQSAFNSYYKIYSEHFGWQAVLLPKGPALLVNIPLGNSVSYQFVMNILTGAWCRFKNWNAEALLVLDGKLYFAVGNTVKEGWIGTADDDASILAVAATAYSYGPSRARGKKIKLVRPVFKVNSAIKLALQLSSNFQDPRAIAPSLSSPTGDSLWDVARFGSSVWGGASVMSQQWRAVRHSPGRAFSLQIGLQLKGVTASWSSTDFIGEVSKLSLA